MDYRILIIGVQDYVITIGQSHSPMVYTVGPYDYRL